MVKISVVSISPFFQRTGKNCLKSPVFRLILYSNASKIAVFGAV